MYLILYIPYLFFLFWIVFAILSIVKGAPFVISKKKARQAMLDLAHIMPGEKTLDLGSGDGSIVIQFAQAGAEAHGYEINLLLVWWSRVRIRLNGLQGRAFIHWGNFWKVDMHAYDVVSVFGIMHIMKDLEKKLRQELQPGSRVVSNTFQFPEWTVSAEQEHVYLYKMS
jgi:cyclopropane fatty-acyl-phospholipid synthase-like methyltransferase